MPYKHLFFDLDKTIAPSREPILPEMYDLLTSLPQDIVIVSGQDTEKIFWQSNELPATRLGQNGNHAVSIEHEELWYTPLTEQERSEILEHIEKLSKLLDTTPNPEYVPIEDRGAQITFSPIGNAAPVELKRTYDPAAKKRQALLDAAPFESENLTIKIGGSTSFDYIHKDRHKGNNVKRLIKHNQWDAEACIYFGDGLHPGGNDEAVIGVIDTIAVEDHNDTFGKLQSLINSKH